MSNRAPDIDQRLLKLHGLPAGVLANQITLFRSPTGGMYHTVETCRSGKGRHSRVHLSRERLTFAPADVGPVRIGKCCISAASAQTSAAVGYTNRLVAANRWLTTATSVLNAPPSVIRKGKALAAATAMPTMWAGQQSDELAQILHDVRDELNAAAASTPNEMVAAAAWSLAGTPQITTGGLFELVGAPSMFALLFGAATAVSHGSAPADAIADALGTFRTTQAAIPVSIDRLPAHCQFERTEFEHPRDWAQAEWEAAFDAQIEAFPKLWLRELAASNTALQDAPNLVVGIVNQRSNPDELRDVTATCFTLQLTSTSHEVLVVIPETLAAAWAAAGSLTYSSAPIPARDALAVLPLAAQLRQETYAQYPLAYTLQTAIAVIAPAA